MSTSAGAGIPQCGQTPERKAVLQAPSLKLWTEPRDRGLTQGQAHPASWLLVTSGPEDHPRAPATPSFLSHPPSDLALL